MYNYGGSFGSSCGCGSYATPAFAPYYPYGGCGCHNNSNYAIVLVLFILLVIVIGSRFTR
ncbi:MAG: YjcZ family sporulation protein [bacterium]|nr:YjcZ family sporulation protein [bacterium]